MFNPLTSPVLFLFQNGTKKSFQHFDFYKIFWLGENNSTNLSNVELYFYFL